MFGAFVYEIRLTMQSLARLSAILCRDPVFRQWLVHDTDFNPGDAAEAAEVVRVVCGIDSRRELDTNPTAAERFHEHLRKPFIEWRDHHEG